MSENITWYACEVRSIDALQDGEGNWIWNASYKIHEGKVREVNKRTAADSLRRAGIKTVKGTAYWTTDDNCLFELRVRKTEEPIYAVFVDELSTHERKELEKESLTYPRILNCTNCGGRFKADKYEDYCPTCKELRA